tara:strand:- start:11310 stop:13424 length:2115 start_codon:yes stop_codon:yes gene_type:complete
MSRLQQYQSSFSHGEIDPLLRGRVDIEQYYSSVAEAKNVIFEPQGGFSRRPGLKYVADYTSDVGTTDEIKLVPFEYSTGQTYLLVLSISNTISQSSTTLRLHVYKDGVLQTNLNGGGANHVDFTLTFATGLHSGFTLRQLNFTQNKDTVIFTNRNMFPFKLVRGASDTTWTFSVLNTLNPPKIRGDLVGLSTGIANPSGTLTASATTGNIKLTTSLSFFNTATVGQQVYQSKGSLGATTWSGFGKAVITKFLSSTTAEAVVLVPFSTTDAISSGEWVFDDSFHDAWSTSIGYPHTCTFHEGRLYFGGTYSLPMTLFGSKVGELNFGPSENLDDDAFVVHMETDTLNTIVGLRSGRDLQIFTTGGEFFIPQADLDPITPSNVSVKSTTKRGSKDGIRPTATEGGTFFIQRQGKALREMLFSDVELSYVANNISLLASHLIVDPKSMAVRPATDTTEGDLLMIVNGTSTTGYRAASSGLGGTLACFMLHKQQNIVAPSFIQTDGTFCDIAVDLDVIYAIVKRTINSATKYYLEVFDDDFTTDSSVQKTSSFSGTSYNLVPHLQAKTVKVVRDDIVESDVSNVNSSGTITTSAQPSSYIETGLDFTVTVKTNPVEPNLPSGRVVTQKKRILEVSPVMYRTQNLTINGFEVPLQTLPYSGGGTVPTITGIKKMHGIAGYNTDAQITISQSKPVFFTVLSMDFKLAVGS